MVFAGAALVFCAVQVCAFGSCDVGAWGPLLACLGPLMSSMDQAAGIVAAAEARRQQEVAEESRRQAEVAEDFAKKRKAHIFLKKAENKRKRSVLVAWAADR